MEVVEKSTEKPISSDAEEPIESATETPSVGGSGGKESSRSESSPAGGGLGGGAVSGLRGIKIYAYHRRQSSFFFSINNR